MSKGQAALKVPIPNQDPRARGEAVADSGECGTWHPWAVKLQEDCRV